MFWHSYSDLHFILRGESKSDIEKSTCSARARPIPVRNSRLVPPCQGLLHLHLHLVRGSSQRHSRATWRPAPGVFPTMCFHRKSITCLCCVCCVCVLDMIFPGTPSVHFFPPAPGVLPTMCFHHKFVLGKYTVEMRLVSSVGWICFPCQT